MKVTAAAVMLATVIMVTLLCGNAAYATSASATVRLQITVVGSLSLNLEDKWLDQDLSDPQAEAYSELKERDIDIDQARRNNITVWRFTKTD